MAKSVQGLSFQEQLAQRVQGKVPEAREDLLQKTVSVAVEVAPAVPVDAPKHNGQKHHQKPYTPEPVTVQEKPEQKLEVVKQIPVQKTDWQEPSVVRIGLHDIRFIDLALRLKKDQKVGTQCQFMLRHGPSVAIFNLSCVGVRVRLCARDATGLFTSVFKRGTELFQDEIFPRDETILPPEQRLAATAMFQEALRSIEIQQLNRRAQDVGVPKALPSADKQQPGFRSKFGEPARRNNRVKSDAK
jgi:hypothetical protein